MSNERNTGLGTGSAQVFDYSGINRAIAKNFDIVRARKAAEEEEAKKKKTATEKAMDKIRGKVDSIDVSKVRREEREYIRNLKTELDKKYSGQYEKIVNQDPKITNEFRDDLAKIENAIFYSIDAKEKETEILRTVNNNELISPERKQEIFEKVHTPGWNPSDPEVPTYFIRTEVRDGFDKNLKDLMPNMDAFYKKEVDISHTNADGSYSKTTKKEWLDSDEAFEVFKDVVTADPEMLLDISLVFGGEGKTADEQFKEAYDRFEKLNKVEEYSRDTKEAPLTDEQKSGRTRTGYGIDIIGLEDGGTRAVVLDKNGKPPYLKKTVTINGKKIALEGGVVDLVKKGNQYIATVNVTKDGWANLSNNEKKEIVINNMRDEGLFRRGEENRLSKEEITNKIEEYKDDIDQELRESGRGVSVKYNFTKAPQYMKSLIGVESIDDLFGKKKGLSEEDQAAYDWAKANPNDPRAKKILRTLE
jgi:hypothetical protein